MDNTKRITRISSHTDGRRFPHVGKLHSSRGFVTTAAMTLLPIMILSALCVMATVWFVEQKEQVQWVCESHNLKSQKNLVRSMNQLLALNPIVETTVLEKKFVQLSLAAAPTPAEKAVLTARLIFLNLKLSGILAQQKSLVLAAHTLAGKELLELKQKLQSHVSKMGSQWQSSLRLHFWSTTPHLRLRKKKIDILGYLYLEHPMVSEQQQIKVDIAITGSRLFPKWLQWISEGPLVWKETCLSKPEKENTIWNAKLKMDKL